MKTDYSEIYSEDDARFNDRPSGWIQWKGTRVCMDTRCSCGHQGHVDADFAYYYKCPCGIKYAVGQNVALIRLTDEQANRLCPDGNPALATDVS